jgi:hypothetical protein
LDIRFDEERKRTIATTRLILPNMMGGERTPVRQRSRSKSASRANASGGRTHVRVEKPGAESLAGSADFCGFIFAGMVLFTLSGYERNSRAYADINSLNDEIDENQLRIKS